MTLLCKTIFNILIHLKRYQITMLRQLNQACKHCNKWRWKNYSTCHKLHTEGFLDKIWLLKLGELNLTNYVTNTNQITVLGIYHNKYCMCTNVCHVFLKVICWSLRHRIIFILIFFSLCRIFFFSMLSCILTNIIQIITVLSMCPL